VKVAEVFRRPIDRRIEEVIKVELDNEATVAVELTEYIATKRIQAALGQILHPFQETIDNPTEDTNIWVSGFFGSGKSSFAKVLGYLVANPILDGKPACDWFFAHTTAPQIKQLLATQIHNRAKTVTVFVDLLSSRNVLNEGESVVLPLYRALLDKLEYSRSVQLAEWEIRLEGEGRYEEFIERYDSLYRRSWLQDHHDPTVKSEMSRVLHDMKPDEFPNADSFYRGHVEIDLSAQSFADRTLLLLKRRGGDSTRVMFIADEAGQYVARDLKRVGDLNGLAEVFQVHKNRLWLVATSQERLEDFVDSLEGSRTEIARLKDRFASSLRVDLLPSDIEDVVAARVLEKSADGQQAVRSAFSATPRNQLNANVRLTGSRGADLIEENVVRLYPLLPYQVRLFIDAVTARREAGMTGGSHRTLLSLSQRLVYPPGLGIGNDEVGRLATVDRAYDALEAIIPPRWRDEVNQVVADRGDDALPTRVLKVIALCVDVRDLTLDAYNIAVMLYTHLGGESIEADVAVALQTLVDEGRIELGTTGYRLQSPEGREWKEARNAITPSIADVNRLRKQLLEAPLGSLTASAGRTFTVELTVGDEKLSKGDVPLAIVEQRPTDLADLVTESRSKPNVNRIWWTHTLSNATQQALEELHKSQEMIRRYQVGLRGGADAELVAHERRLVDEWETKARRGLEGDLAAGRIVFHGRVDPTPSGDLKAMGQKVVEERIPEIYTRLSEFAASLKSTDPQLMLREVSLDGIPASLSAIKLVVLRPTGKEIETKAGPLKVVLDEIRNSRSGEPPGSELAVTFSNPPYGATLEVLQAIVAAGVREGLVDVRYQGALIKNPSDHRLDAVFKGPAAFRSASFRPHEETIPVEKRVELGKRLTALVGSKVNANTDELARTTRAQFADDGTAADKVRATLLGLGLPIPNAVATVADTVRDLQVGDDDGTVLTALAIWDDLVAGRSTVADLAVLVDNHLTELRAAQLVAASSPGALPGSLAGEHAELRDLLHAGDLAAKLGRIMAITSAITTHRSNRLSDLRAELRERIDNECFSLSARYPGVNADSMAEILARLAQLAPADTEHPAPELVEARLSAFESTAADVAHQLDILVAKDRLFTIRISEIAPDLIRTPPELAVVVERLQRRIAELLGDDKEVRLI
jgi:hypothetical protein